MSLLDAACDALVFMRKHRDEIRTLSESAQQDFFEVAISLHMGIRDAGLDPSNHDPRKCDMKDKAQNMRRQGFCARSTRRENAE